MFLQAVETVEEKIQVFFQSLDTAREVPFERGVEDGLVLVYEFAAAKAVGLEVHGDELSELVQHSSVILTMQLGVAGGDQGAVEFPVILLPGFTVRLFIIEHFFFDGG